MSNFKQAGCVIAALSIGVGMPLSAQDTTASTAENAATCSDLIGASVPKDQIGLKTSGADPCALPCLGGHTPL